MPLEWPQRFNLLLCRGNFKFPVQELYLYLDSAELRMQVGDKYSFYFPAVRRNYSFSVGRGSLALVSDNNVGT